MTQATINGETRTIDEGLTIATLLESRGIDARTVVVEHNAVIVARAKFGDVAVNEGDTLEIVQMMAGG